MSQAELQRLALLIAVNCVRNTVIEDYHADGKLTDTEMMAFNREVANKIFTFLTYLFEKPADDRAAFLCLMAIMYPTDWDKPKLDSGFVKAVHSFREPGNTLTRALDGSAAKRAAKPGKKARKPKKR